MKVASLNSTASGASAERSPPHIPTVTNFPPRTANLSLDGAQHLTANVIHLCLNARSFVVHLTRSTLEGLAEHEQLDLVVDRKYTSTSDTTEDIGTGTLE